jgi:hypothetical protein
VGPPAVATNGHITIRAIPVAIDVMATRLAIHYIMKPRPLAV